MPHDSIAGDRVELLLDDPGQTARVTAARHALLRAPSTFNRRSIVYTKPRRSTCMLWLGALLTLGLAPRASQAQTPRDVELAERSLATKAELDVILRIALAQNPELREGEQRARAAHELVPAASHLPDLEVEYQLWAQPLARPYALGDADMHMFGVRQPFPAPGSLQARSRTAAAQASIAAEAQRAKRLELTARVRRAFAQYYRADREYRIHLEHVGLAQQTSDLVRGAYQAGRGTQQDVLRAMVELSRLHSDVVAIDRDRRTASALLNTLMARPPQAPLGPAAAIDPGKGDVPIEPVERQLDQRRPELAAAESAVRARQGELDAARASARWPSFMLGAQYMFMPTSEEHHNYGVMLSMSLPWLNARYGEEVAAAQSTLAAERSALASAQLAARYALFDATERLKAERESLAIIERDLLAQATLIFDTARAAYATGQLDSLGLFEALRSLFDVRLERERAISRLETARADLELAAGGSVSPTSKERE